MPESTGGWDRRWKCSLCDTRFSSLWSTPLAEERVGVYAPLPDWLEAMSRSICFGPRRMRPVSLNCRRPRLDVIRMAADRLVEEDNPVVRALFGVRRLPRREEELGDETPNFERAGVYVLPAPGEAAG